MKLRRYSILQVGLIIASTIYILTLTLDLDLYEKITYELTKWEHHEIDEFVLPIFILLVFAFLNEILWIRKIRLQNEKNKVYRATIWSSQYVLNNCLNQMSILKRIAEATPDFSPSAIALLDDVINDATQQIEALSSIKNLEENEIKNSVLKT